MCFVELHDVVRLGVMCDVTFNCVGWIHAAFVILIVRTHMRGIDDNEQQTGGC